MENQAYLIALGLILTLSTAGSTHGVASNIAGRGLRGVYSGGGVRTRTRNVTVLKVGQPASADRFVVDGSFKSGCG